jgi:type II secretory pathway component PulC
MRSFVIISGISVWLLMGLTLTSAHPEATSGSTGAQMLQVHKLVGIVYGDQKIAGVVFEDSRTKKQKVYRIGDMIEGAAVMEIRRRQVLLRRGGEILMVYLSNGSPGEQKTEGSISIPDDSPHQALQQVLSQIIPPYDPRVNDRKRSVTRVDLNRFSEQINAQEKEGPIFVSTSLGPTLGLARIDQNVLASLGLESTDLIVGISGMGIDSWERLQRILTILGQAKVLDISVLRGSVVQPMYYAVQ